MDVVNATQGGASVLGKAEHDDSEIQPEGVEHGVELRPDIAAKNGAGLVMELAATRLLQFARGSEHFAIGDFRWIEARISIEDQDVGCLQIVLRRGERG